MSRRHAGMGGRFWALRRERVLRRDGRRCFECGKAGRLEVHHVVHLSDGGTNDEENLVTLCRDCHIRAHRPRESQSRSEWRTSVQELEEGI